MASRNSCPNSVYNHSGARAERKSVEHSVPNCSESPLATRVEFVDGVAAYPYVFQKIQERIHILTVAADAGQILTAAEYRTRTRNRRHLRRGHICADSQLYSARQLCLRAWPWRQRFVRKFPSKSAFQPSKSANHPSAHGATTKLGLTAARPRAFTGRGTSTTASSWAWAPGPAGDMPTAGASIAST